MFCVEREFILSLPDKYQATVIGLFNSTSRYLDDKYQADVVGAFNFTPRYLDGKYQAIVVGAFNSTSRYLDDLLNIDNYYFKQMTNQIYTVNYS